MFAKHKNYWFAGTVIALAVLLGACSGTLPANLPDSVELEVEDGVEELEFSGTIEEMGADGWTVAGVSFDVTSSTEIKGEFEVGDSVKVHAQLGSEDQLSAREIEFLKEEMEDDKDLEDEDEFTGVIDSIGDGTWVIDGTDVAVTDATEIKGDLSQGDLVKVHASLIDGTLTAREIELADDDDLDDEDESDDLEDEDDMEDSDDDSEEFVGIVEAIDGDMWTVNGMTFKVTSDTEMDDDIQIGDLVEVELDSDSDAGVIAEEIELADDIDDDSDDEFDDDDDADDDSDDHDDDHDDEDDEDDEDDHDDGHDSDDSHDDDDEEDDD